MSAKEDVVKGLWSCTHAGNCTDCPFDIKGGTECDEASTCILNLIKAAYEVLKAQEPIEPVVDVDVWRCGNCGHVLEHQEMIGNNILFHEQYAYCPNCGRPVKWHE